MEQGQPSNDVRLISRMGLLEARAAHRRPTSDTLVAVDWGRPELALCLLVDASGSMGGARLAAAALTAAACAIRAPGDHAFLAYGRCRNWSSSLPQTTATRLQRSRLDPELAGCP